MRIRNIAFLILSIPLTLLASDINSEGTDIDGNKKPKKGTSTANTDSTAAETKVQLDTSEIASLGFIASVDLEENDQTDVYSIVSFDANELPLDEDLYRYHVSKLQFEIPMDYNLLVKRQIDYFGTSWQVRLKEMVTKSQYFFPIYEEILGEYNMPLEIKYLSIIESGLNPYAKSRSGAVGAWQFMPATGKIFDLAINSDVDERRSLEKSTRAACMYLKQMYNIYGDWLVALASYNCGPGNVRKAIRLSGSSDFWGMYDYLPRETQNYVPKFIAMAYLMNYHSEFGITPVPIDATLFLTQKVYCEEGLNFNVIAEKLELTSDELLRYNPELKVASIPYNGQGYILQLPEDKAYLYYIYHSDIVELSIASADSVVSVEPGSTSIKNTNITYYIVKKGDSLQRIAYRNKVTVSQLRKWNGISGSTIHPKQKLKIYK